MDKLMSIDIEDVQAIAEGSYEHEHKISYRNAAINLAKQLLDTMRELEYYRKLATDLSTGAAHVFDGVQMMQNQRLVYPNKDSDNG